MTSFNNSDSTYLLSQSPFTDEKSRDPKPIRLLVSYQSFWFLKKLLSVSKLLDLSCTFS